MNTRHIFNYRSIRDRAMLVSHVLSIGGYQIAKISRGSLIGLITKGFYYDLQEIDNGPRR